MGHMFSIWMYKETIKTIFQSHQLNSLVILGCVIVFSRLQTVFKLFS